MIKYFVLSIIATFFNVVNVNEVRAEEVQLHCHIHADRLFKDCIDRHPKKMKLCKHMVKAHQHKCKLPHR